MTHPHSPEDGIIQPSLGYFHNQNDVTDVCFLESFRGSFSVFVSDHTYRTFIRQRPVIIIQRVQNCIHASLSTARRNRMVPTGSKCPHKKETKRSKRRDQRCQQPFNLNQHCHQNTNENRTHKRTLDPVGLGSIHTDGALQRPLARMRESERGSKAIGN